MPPSDRPLKILIVATGNLLMPASGGELRVRHLAGELAALGHRVDVVAFVVSNHPSGLEREVEGRLRITQRHSLWLDLAAVADRFRLLPITELPRWLAPLRLWLWRLVRRERYDVVQFDFPWFLPLYGAAGRAAVVYSAHNVESAWWAPRLAAYPFGEFFRRRLVKTEIRAAARARGVVACSEPDLVWLREQAGAADLKTCLVPNGFDARRFRPPTPAEREWARRELGFAPDEKIALFTGSHTHPNREAAEAILRRILPACPDPAVRFVIIGRVGETLHGWRAACGAEDLTARVTITGAVEDVLPWLHAADVALNPMLSGSGSNLKVAEACAAGLPLVTTPFGLRGFEALAPWVTVRPIEGFAGAIAASRWPGTIPEKKLKAHSWATAARTLAGFYEALARRDEAATAQTGHFSRDSLPDSK